MCNSKSSTKFTTSSNLLNSFDFYEMDKSLSQSQTSNLMSSNVDTKKTPSPWINAWRDAVIGINAYSQNIQLSDLRGDGDYKFLVATNTKKLIAYKGANLDWEMYLLDNPIAVATFYSETSKIRKKFILSQNLFQPLFLLK